MPPAFAPPCGLAPGGGVGSLSGRRHQRGSYFPAGQAWYCPAGSSFRRAGGTRIYQRDKAMPEHQARFSPAGGPRGSFRSSPAFRTFTPPAPRPCHTANGRRSDHAGHRGHQATRRFSRKWVLIPVPIGMDHRWKTTPGFRPGFAGGIIPPPRGRKPSGR